MLGVTLSELLSGLEDGGTVRRIETRAKAEAAPRYTLEVEKLARRLAHQRAAMDRTISDLEELTLGRSVTPEPGAGSNVASRRGSKNPENHVVCDTTVPLHPLSRRSVPEKHMPRSSGLLNPQNHGLPFWRIVCLLAGAVSTSFR